jgi:hypothetical protein
LSVEPRRMPLQPTAVDVVVDKSRSMERVNVHAVLSAIESSHHAVIANTIAKRYSNANQESVLGLLEYACGSQLRNASLPLLVITDSDINRFRPLLPHEPLWPARCNAPMPAIWLLIADAKPATCMSTSLHHVAHSIDSPFDSLSTVVSTICRCFESVA